MGAAHLETDKEMQPKLHCQEGESLKNAWRRKHLVTDREIVKKSRISEQQELNGFSMILERERMQEEAVG